MANKLFLPLSIGRSPVEQPKLIKTFRGENDEVFNIPPLECINPPCVPKRNEKVSGKQPKIELPRKYSDSYIYHKHFEERCPKRGNYEVCVRPQRTPAQLRFNADMREEVIRLEEKLKLPTHNAKKYFEKGKLVKFDSPIGYLHKVSLKLASPTCSAEQIYIPSTKLHPRPYKTKNCLTLAQRINVINYSEANENLRTAQLAEIFDCSYSQIREILLRKDSIRNAYENNETLPPPYNKKKKKNFQHKSIEMKAIKYIIMEWFMRYKFLGITLDDNKILDMAEHTANLLQYKEFHQNVSNIKKKWVMTIRSAENSREFKAYSMKLNNIPKTSLKIEDIIIEIQSTLPSEIQEKLSCLIIKNELNHDDENVGIFNWNDEIISLSSSDSDSRDIDVGFNENWCGNDIRNDVKNEDTFTDTSQPNDSNCANTFSSFDGNISIDNNEFITFTDFNETPDYNNRKSGVIPNYHDALEQVKRLEEFALNQEDIKAIDLIGCLKSHFKNRMLN